MIDYIYATHVTFMVFWVSSLFFIGRMMIYDNESKLKDKVEKNAIQVLCRSAIKKTFFIITWPSLIITVLVGLKLMFLIQAHKFGWFHGKMFLVVLLVIYTINSFMSYKKMLKNELTKSPVFMRIYNEIPGILSLMIIFTVYTKNIMAGLIATAILFLFVSIIILIVRQKRKSVS